MKRNVAFCTEPVSTEVTLLGTRAGLSLSTHTHAHMHTFAHGDLLSAGESGVQCPHWRVLKEEKDEEWMGLRGKVEGARGGKGVKTGIGM